MPPLHYTQKFLPHSGADYGHYAGGEISDELLDSTHFEGSAPKIVEKIVEKVLLRLAKPSKVVGLKREEKIPLPRKVLRELLVNAVCHRNPLIVKFMENLRYIDGIGRGVPMIFREMNNLGAKTPQIFADDTQVRFVIYFAPTEF